ncbi:MAG: hypothetical protein ACLP7O_06495 [Terracidiphilus sp.]
MNFLVHPDLRAVVRGNDRAYIESLLPDLVKRAQQHPADLFQQLSSLEVGPLATQVVGTDLKDHPALQELSSTFVQL